MIICHSILLAAAILSSHHVVSGQLWQTVTEPTPRWMIRGSSVTVDKGQSSASPVDIFCFKGIDSRPWHVFRTVELYIAMSSPADNDEFQYFVSETANGAFREWQNAQTETTPIVSWFTQLLVKLPLRLLFGASKGGNSTLDQLFFPSSPPSIAFNPFQQTCVAISSAKSYTATLHISAISGLLAFITALGGGLFLAAPLLVSAEMFYYISGSGLGVVSCALIAIIVLFRYMPMRKPFVVLVTIIGSSALWVGLARRIIEFLADHLYIAAILVAIAAIAGFAVSYWYGPPKSPRAKNLISWLLQAIGLFFVVFGTCNVPYVSLLMIIACLLYRNKKYLVIPLRARLFLYKVFPFKKRLLTMEEYEQQGREETRKQMESLRTFVNSPDCDPWQLVQRLKDPVKFAKFVSPHSTPVANGNGHYRGNSNGNGHALMASYYDGESDDDIDDDELNSTDDEQLHMEVDEDIISDDDD